MKPELGQANGLLSLIMIKAYLGVILSSWTKYAIHKLTDRDIPAAQCTRTFVVWR